jgi:hypothetical protein
VIRPRRRRLSHPARSGGAKPLNEIKLPALRYSTFADPGGNDFDLVTWQSE